MNAKLTLFGLTAIMMLAVGFIVIEDSEDSDAAPSYILKASDLMNCDNRNWFVESGTYVYVSDSIETEGGTTVRYTSDVSSFTITSSNPEKTIIITKKNNSTGVVLDTRYIFWEYNSGGYTWNLGVRFYANGGTNAPSNQLYVNQPSNLKEVTLSSSQPTPPSGATFLGWSESQTATYPDYYPGDSFIIYSEGLSNLYAVYETQTIYTFNLVYNANGGSNPPATQTWSGTATSYVFTVSSSSPTPAVGSTFYGWNTDQNSDWPAYVGGDTISVTISGGSTTATVTLYAIYDIPKYTVRINVNDPSYGTVSPTVIYNVPKYTYVNFGNNEMWVGNTTVTVTKNPGYSWGFWSNNISGTDLPVWIESDITFTANLTGSLYTVNFDTEFSPHGTVYPTEIRNVPYGSPITVNGNTITINGTTVTATPDANYSFDHWYSVVPSTGYNIPSTVTDTMRITAFFTDDRTFSLIYDMKGGSPQIPTDTNTTLSSVNSVNFTVSYAEPTKTGYYLRGWSYSSAATTVDLRSGDTVTVTWAGDGGSKTIYAVWEPNAHHIFNLYYDMNGGTPQLETQIYDGSNVTWSHTFFIPNISPTKAGYTFVGWGIEEGSSVPYFYPGGYVTVAYSEGSGDLTLYAIWEEDEPMSSAVYWSNNNYNGSVSILFKFDASDNKGHSLNMDLLTGTVADDQTTTWTDSGYSLSIDISYPSLTVTATLTDGVHNMSRMVSAGNWSTFILTIDSDGGIVSMIPIKTFNSFTDYTTYESQKRTVIDFSSEIRGSAIFTIAHTETDEGTNSPRFSVVGTSVFLNTFGVVLYNPTINLHDYFPQYDAIRVNFYSFALYGESITINGHTWDLDGSKITIEYVSDGSDHYLPGVMPNATVQTRTFELANIYVTYQDNHCYLTFVNDRFTIDLGPYTIGNETISMVGLWYFATMVYEPYTAVEKHVSDWKMIPETNGSQMVLMFLGILIVAGAAIAIHVRKSGLGIIDLVIIGGALVVGLLTLG